MACSGGGLHPAVCGWTKPGIEISLSCWTWYKRRARRVSCDILVSETIVETAPGGLFHPSVSTPKRTMVLLQITMTGWSVPSISLNPSGCEIKHAET